MITRAHQLMLAMLGQEKAAGAISKALHEGAKGYFALGREMGEIAAEHGAGPLTQAAFKYAPHVGAVVAGKKAWESEPARRLRYKIQEFRNRRAMRRAMAGG